MIFQQTSNRMNDKLLNISPSEKHMQTPQSIFYFIFIMKTNNSELLYSEFSFISGLGILLIRDTFVLYLFNERL